MIYEQVWDGQVPWRILSKRIAAQSKGFRQPEISCSLSVWEKGKYPYFSGFTHVQPTYSEVAWPSRYLRPFPDPLVKVYDLRTMRPLPPIPFSAVPAFIHVLPKRSSSLAVVSNHGLINIVDVSNPSAASEFYQVGQLRHQEMYLISGLA